MPSSAATVATPSGIPTPRFATELILSCIAARRAITLRTSSGAARVAVTADAHVADVGRVVPLGKRLHVGGGIGGYDDTVDKDPGDTDIAGTVEVAGRHALDLHDHDPAGVLRCLRDRKRIQRGSLALGRHVAVLVGGRAAQNGDIDRPRRIEQDSSPSSCITRTTSAGDTTFIRPPSTRGSTNVPSPVRVISPGRPAAVSR